MVILYFWQMKEIFNSIFPGELQKQNPFSDKNPWRRLFWYLQIFSNLYILCIYGFFLYLYNVVLSFRIGTILSIESVYYFLLILFCDILSYGDINQCFALLFTYFIFLYRVEVLFKNLKQNNILGGILCMMDYFNKSRKSLYYVIGLFVTVGLGGEAPFKPLAYLCIIGAAYIAFNFLG